MKPVASGFGSVILLSTMSLLGGAFYFSPVTPVLAAEPAVVTNPTFSKDIAPLFQDHCQVCHRPGAQGPMSLVSYSDVRPWARAIKTRTMKREMPPWLVDPNVGVNHFKNDPSLTAQEISTIAAWVDAGTPEGNPSDMPPLKQWPDSYAWDPSLGPPDLIVQLPHEVLLKANTPNLWADYYTESGLKEDRYLRAVQSLPGPGAARVVHHFHAYLIQDMNGNGVEQEMHVNEYAMGKGAEKYPEGTAKVAKAGARVKFNLHYAPSNVDVVDRARVGMWFYPKGYVPKHTIIVTPTAQNNETLDLPPGESNVRNDGYQLMDSAIRISSFQPHMHDRGKRQCLEAIYPNGRTETLVCANWDFGWHIQYQFAEDVQPILPKGSIIHQISWYDNSAANKWNPDPTNWIGYGRRTSDEMSFVWLGYYKITDEEYAQMRKERAAVRSSPNVGGQ
jgi:hypothetical protein